MDQELQFTKLEFKCWQCRSMDYDSARSLDCNFPTIVKFGDGYVFRGALLYIKAYFQLPPIYGKPTVQLPLVYHRTEGGEGSEFCTNRTLFSRLVKGKIVVYDKGINATTEKEEFMAVVH
ncbi:hypothetical protein FXO37_23618 [Capsicum annuum]|nr:hypothetical protein FXO37_23618 [Capsicum annuum]